MWQNQTELNDLALNDLASFTATRLNQPAPKITIMSYSEVLIKS